MFTPAWLVEAMLDLVKDETERIDSRFLEPACGDGNVLTGSSAFSAEDSLFADLGRHEIFPLTRTYSPMTVIELASSALAAAPKEDVS